MTLLLKFHKVRLLNEPAQMLKSFSIEVAGMDQFLCDIEASCENYNQPQLIAYLNCVFLELRIYLFSVSHPTNSCVLASSYPYTALLFSFLI